jgi:hypothetical protein
MIVITNRNVRRAILLAMTFFTFSNQAFRNSTTVVCDVPKFINMEASENSKMLIK